MTGLTKIRSRWEEHGVTVKIRVVHPMESGFRFDKDNERFIPATDKKTGKRLKPYYIERVSAKHNGKPVFNTRWGGAIARNPGLSFRLESAKKGDIVKITWVDNRGNTGGASHIVE